MSGVLVIAEARSAPDTQPALRQVTLELIAAGRELARDGAGPLAVALLAHDADALVDQLAVEGVEEVLLLATPEPRPEAHVSQAAVEALLERRRPSLVLAGHTIDSLGYAPAVAARGRHGFASDVTAVSWSPTGARAQRPAYGERLLAELEFPGKQTVLLLLREGAFAPATGAGSPTVTRVELDLVGRARSERVELREAPAGERDIAKADFLLSIGRGVGAAEHVARMQRLADAIGATLAVSGPLVEAGWAPRALKVGQSGRTVAPRVYLALGISGAAQHLGGMSRSQTIIAVNRDPRARIFDFAHYGAVADLFEVADELERRVG
ncbi:MAG: electron transfer flavoprotein alpha subunit [Solirubrobacteraceae bacterium]|nr:electron transfer flavoprotein alpha subunit [Solirubrobacteraceae bacterium]